MKEKFLKNLLYGFYVIATVAALGFLLQFFSVSDFFTEIENKTFDVRQSVIADFKKVNKDIVILSVDDPSYEYIVSTYGAWPAPRDFWANLAKEIEKQNPKAIVFDLIFAHNFKAFGNADKKLSDIVNANKNIYVSMNFDNQPAEVRKPIDLPNQLSTNIEGNKTLLDKADLIHYGNVREILPEIMEGSDNIGFVNISRDKDGVIRSFLPIFGYKNQYYKHLTLLVALDILNLDSKNIKIQGNDIVLDNGTKIPVDENGRCYLNWYGGAGMYEYIPIWKTDKAIKEGDTKFLEETFKDKIVYVGTVTTSLSDVKTTPLAQKYPGVETHTTFLNNIFDNNFIKNTGFLIDAIITVVIVLLSTLIVVHSKSVIRGVIGVFALIIMYAVLSTLVMYYFNIWTALVLPVMASVATITATYIIKYIITSRDYEHTYKLAVTDGLTDMYNHRYFQEQMKANIDNSARYNTSFSLIMVDIDFFKKFNDKYGHQSGDAVLRQVAQTIKKNIRSTDIPCRYGGEEMSVILTNTGKDEAALVAQKICEAVRNKEFELATGDWTHVTISLGVATAPENGTSTQGLIEYADKCLYIAKENGRNQVIYDINQDPKKNNQE